MGLEMVEIVMEVEETFGIALDDRDCGGIVTVADLYYCIKHELPEGQHATCPTASVFYRVRRAMTSLWNIPRDRVRPTESLDRLVPRRGRRAAWERLAEELGVRLPKLRWTGWLGCLFGIAAAAAFLGMPMSFLAGRAAFPIFSLSLLIFATYFVVARSKVLETRFDSGCQTVAGLARSVVAVNPSMYSTASLPIESDPVWERLVVIVSDQLGVRRDQISPDTQFVRDLGCD